MSQEYYLRSPSNLSERVSHPRMRLECLAHLDPTADRLSRHPPWSNEFCQGPTLSVPTTPSKWESLHKLSFWHFVAQFYSQHRIGKSPQCSSWRSILGRCRKQMRWSLQLRLTGGIKQANPPSQSWSSWQALSWGIQIWFPRLTAPERVVASWYCSTRYESHVNSAKPRTWVLPSQHPTKRVSCPKTPMQSFSLSAAPT